MATKVKARRHSFSSLEETVKEVGKEPPTRWTVNATVDIPRNERKRKNPCDPSMATPEVKKVAAPASLVHLMESMQEVARKDHKPKTSDDFLCCLPGGRLGDCLPFRYTSLQKSLSGFRSGVGKLISWLTCPVYWVCCKFWQFLLATPTNFLPAYVWFKKKYTHLTQYTFFHHALISGFSI